METNHLSTAAITHEDLMRHAIDAARRGIAAGQTPFGCAIARDGVLLAAAHNTVVGSIDSTAHAEINALREACKTSGSHLLEGAVAALTCEPCPMCMAALHWARVETVHYGAAISDAAEAGFNELSLAADELLRLGRSNVRLCSNVLADECRGLFQEWLARPQRISY